MKVKKNFITSSYSHAPVIVLMSLLLPIKRVLELGAGGISTSIFVNQTIYPAMERFDTYDNGPANYVKTCRGIVATTGSAKYQLKYSKEKMVAMVSKTDVNSYDLILIDDSADVKLRAETISNVTERIKEGPVILIHDFEQLDYQGAVRGEFNRFVFSSILPHTGVLWKKSILSDIKLEDYPVLIKQHFPTHESDYLKWKQLFENQMKS